VLSSTRITRQHCPENDGIRECRDALV
jgi:hypothetical protein